MRYEDLSFCGESSGIAKTMLCTVMRLSSGEEGEEGEERTRKGSEPTTYDL